MDATTLFTAGFIISLLINFMALIWVAKLAKSVNIKSANKKPEPHIDSIKLFSDSELADFKKQASQQLDQTLKNTLSNLSEQINSSTVSITNNINEIIKDAVRQEFDKYQANLRAINNETIEQFGKVQADLQAQRLALFKQLEEEVAIERNKRLATFNNRINDVVSSYLAETIGNNVDLGAQTTYILDSLEKHKNELKRDILA